MPESCSSFCRTLSHKDSWLSLITTKFDLSLSEMAFLNAIFKAEHPVPVQSAELQYHLLKQKFNIMPHLTLTANQTPWQHVITNPRVYHFMWFEPTNYFFVFQWVYKRTLHFCLQWNNIHRMFVL